MNLPALRLVHASLGFPKGHSGHPKGLEPYFFLLTNRRNLAGDFHSFPSEVVPSLELAYERSNSFAIISPTAFNLCPTKGATDAHNHVHQNEQRDLMARASPRSAMLDESLAGSVVFSADMRLSAPKIIQQRPQARGLKAVLNPQERSELICSAARFAVPCC
jgi:hypothetical protein